MEPCVFTKGETQALRPQPLDCCIEQTALEQQGPQRKRRQIRSLMLHGCCVTAISPAFVFHACTSLRRVCIMSVCLKHMDHFQPSCIVVEHL